MQSQNAPCHVVRHELNCKRDVYAESSAEPDDTDEVSAKCELSLHTVAISRPQ